MPDCVALLDENARIINVNEQFLDLLKIRDKTILKGMHFTKMISQRGSIKNLNGMSDHEARFNIQFWGEDIPCHIIYKQPIYTPYGTQLILSFKRLTDKNFAPAVPSANILPGRTFSFDEIIGKNPEIDRIKSTAKRAAKSLATVLIEGESGTGKELFAEAIHWESQRKGLFLAINCGAIPSELIQSELFGYEEGAFTGAKKRGSPGKFEIADCGTVFLDEIGEMPVNMQVSLLRFLQDKTVTRVGGYIPKKVDVRIIAATNRNLKAEVDKGNFREDLYYRLNVINLQIPPLRKRKEDIPLIANFLLKKLCNRYEIPPIKISRSSGATLINYNWPGNVRELENIIERAFIMREGEELIFDSSVITLVPIKGSSKEQIEASMGKIEKEAIENHLSVNGGNISRTSQALGISRKTLYKKIKMLNINRDAYIN
ncbi:MAG: sigma 54-interacting transcriptional regulator, partial [Oscillospiraceae bacterium]